MSRFIQDTQFVTAKYIFNCHAFQLDQATTNSQYVETQDPQCQNQEDEVNRIDSRKQLSLEHFFPRDQHYGIQNEPGDIFL